MKRCNACGAQSNDSADFCQKCGKPLEKTSTSPRRSSMELNIIYGIIILVIAGIVLTRKSWQPFLEQIQSASRGAAMTKITYNWQKFDVGNTGLSLESPVEMKLKIIKLPENIKPMIAEMVAYGFASRPFSIDSVYVMYQNGINISLKGAEMGAIANLRQMRFVKDLNYTSKNVKISGRAGTQIDGSFRAGRVNMKMTAILAADGQKLYQVVCVYDAQDPQAGEASARVINSINIK